MPKAAVTLCDWLIVTWQVPVPVQAPLHPPNTEPVDAVAVSETTVPAANGAEQSPLVPPPVMVQLMPGPVTVPLPVELPCTVSVNCWGAGLNVAVTPRAWLIVI